MRLASDVDQSTTWNVTLGVGRSWERSIAFTRPDGSPVTVSAATVTAQVQTDPLTPIEVTQGSASNVVNLRVAAAAIQASASREIGRWDWSIEIDDSRWFSGWFELERKGNTAVRQDNLFNVVVDGERIIAATVNTGLQGPPGGPFFTDSNGYLVALVPSRDDSLSLDDDDTIVVTIGD